MNSIRMLQKNKIRHRFSENVIQAFIYAVLVALCLLIVLPCLNILALAFNDGADAARGGIYFWPRIWTLKNFQSVFEDSKITNAYIITVSRTVLGTFLSLFVTSLAAFALKDAKLPGRKVISFLITFTMLFSGGLIPTYIQYNNLRLLNTFWIYIVPGLMSVVYLMMMRTSFETIPESLEESAKLDGAGYYRIYFMIVLPLSKAVLAVIGLYTAVGHWNDWFSGAFYMKNNKLWPVQTVLQQMLARAISTQQPTTTVSQALAHQSNTVTSDSLKMATVVITTAPILCIYPFVQKYFAKGVMIGAVKG